MHKSSLVIAVALAAASMAAVGCGSDSDDSGDGSGGSATKKVDLTLILNDLTNPVSVPLRKGAEDAAKKLGFNLKIVGPNPSTAQEQINILQTVQTQKPDGIVILPVDTGALTPAIDRAVGAGIPV